LKNFFDTAIYQFSLLPKVFARNIRATPFTKTVYIILLSHTDKNGACFPGIDLIAAEASMSSRQVTRAIKDLKDRHILRVERHKGPHGSYNVYLLSDPSKWKLTDEEKANFEKDDVYRPPGSDYQEGVDSQSTGGVDSQSTGVRTDGGGGVDPQSTGVWTDSPMKYTQFKKTQRSKPPDSPPGGFVSFMLVYPKGSHEQQALEEWMKLDPDEALASHIAACVERAQGSEQWKKGMIPYAYKYLRDQCWKDDRPLLAPATGPSNGGWSFDAKTKTYEQLTDDGKWTKHPRSDVPLDVIQQFEVNPVTPFARTAAEPKVTS
jgi:hypothetical protein